MIQTGKTEVQAERPVNDNSHIECIRILFTLRPERTAINFPTRNVKILFSCYIACKASHIIDKMRLIVICNCRIILKEVLLK